MKKNERLRFYTLLRFKVDVFIVMSHICVNILVNFLKKYFSNFLKNEVESKFTHDAGEFE
jgi:hypothetical protein